MTASASFADWLALSPGHAFPPRVGSLTAAAQARQHAACDVPAGLFEGRVDPTLLGQDMVLMASRAGLAVDGRVHLAHRIRQCAPLTFSLGYEVQGRVGKLAPARRGHEVEVLASVAGPLPARQAPVELAARYLLPGLAPSAEAAPAPVPIGSAAATLSPIGQLNLTPERVMSYSADVGNLLHFDPAFAAARGFRAPIAQGLMVVTAFFGALARAQGAVPERFELTARFRRPALWDDRLEFRRGDGSWCCTASDGRVLVEGELELDRGRG